MNILVTGTNGFIGRNLKVRLGELGHGNLLEVTREMSIDELYAAAAVADVVFHLAGINRPVHDSEFTTGNSELTAKLCAALAATGRRATVIYTSSSQATLDNPYGRSKRAAEEALLAYSKETGAPVQIFRLPNVFGKWSRPNYNSAVATFCHQVANGLPMTIHDPSAALRLVYIDDVIDAFMGALNGKMIGTSYEDVKPVYETTVGEVSSILGSFSQSRTSLVTPRVGTGLVRALHSTYLSFLPPHAFTYTVPSHVDQRGEFVEMLKTPDSGQVSYFTAHPGVTRGEHYHHSKTEKFLVVRGSARFGFRHIATDQTFEVLTKGGEGRIVETVPGWAHNVTNIGSDELVVMLWANEIFDKARPDTFSGKVDL